MTQFIPYEPTIVQAPLVIFTIFDLTPFFFCIGQHLQTRTLINDSQNDASKLVSTSSSSSSSRKAVNNNNKDHEALQQLHKLYILTLTSSYVVTQTAISYSYSSSTTTIIHFFRFKRYCSICWLFGWGIVRLCSYWHGPIFDF
ncbi:hypothetical protein BCR42DRAFT_435927 [Absidia repens]|uniref:Uncharacterized protein n=1 Tax=Absidia repens TaxID=90262 RepID=A0A1X2IMU7_9FUNG|nr:hypothetical protein BCR42DRAFT_435927 [Absidia repens]